MASEAELADLFLTLRAVNAPLLRSFEESATAGESMVAALNTMFGEIDAMLARTAESAAALRTELAGIGEAGAMASGAGAGAAVTGTAEGAAAGAATTGAGVAAEAEAAAVSTATNEEVAAWDRVLAEMAQVRAETAMTAQADATEWSAMATRISAANEEMIASTKRYGDTMAATGAKVDTAAAAQSTVGAKLSAVTGFLKGPAIAAAVVGVAVVKMAADFETSTNRLVTSAGEVPSQLGMVRQGLLDLSGQVGMTASALSKAMYTIESANYHGQAALNILKYGVQGAKAEGADAKVVVDALTSALRDYFPKAQSAGEVTRAAADTMSKLIAATSQGKMTFGELASGLNNILPIASQYNLKMADVLGVTAAMTVHGISVQQATENINHAIQKLASGGTPQMAGAMAAMGASALDVQQHLGDRGLAGTMQYLSGKVKAMMPPGSEKVVVDLTNAVKKSTPAVQDLAAKFVAGSITMKDFNLQANLLDPISAKQAKAFSTLAGNYHKLGDEQKSGADVLQSYGGMMQKVTGDMTTLKVALFTTGDNAQYTNNAIRAISAATVDAQGNVKGWSEVQGTFNQKVSEAKGSLDALGISVGQKLLPVVTKVATVVANASQWLTKHGQVATILAGIIGGILVTALVAYTAKILWSIGETAVSFAMDIAKGSWWVATKIGQFVAVSMSAGAEAFATAGRWIYANGVILASEAADGAVWVATAVTNFVSVSASAVVEAAKTAAAWLASTAKLAVQGLASLATWAAESAARFGAAALAAASSATATTLAWLGAMAAMTGQVIARAAVWVTGMVVEYGAVALAAVVSAATTVAAWVAANIALIVATGGIILLIGLLVAAAVWVVTHWKEVSAFFVGLWHDIEAIFTSAVHGAINIIKAWYPLILGILSGGLFLVPALIFKYWRQIADFFKDLWNKVSGVFRDGWNHVWGWIKDQWEKGVHKDIAIWEDIGRFFSNLWKNVKQKFTDGWHNLWNWVKDQWDQGIHKDVMVWLDISKFFSNLWTNIKNWVQDKVREIVSNLKREWNDFLNFWKGVGDGIKTRAQDAWNAVVDFFKGIPNRVKGFFSDAGRWLADAGRAILNGLLGGLKDAWNAVTGFIGGIGNWISSHKGPIEVDRQLLTPHGNAIMQGLLSGLQAGGRHVTNYLDDFTQGLGATGVGALQVGMQVTAGSSPAGMAPFAGGTPAGTSGGGITVNVYVSGSVTTENALVRSVQQGILQLSGRNSGFGLSNAFQ